jgi:hypothetical protein
VAEEAIPRPVGRGRDLALEALVIIFSVLAALFAENLWSDRQDSADADAALAALVSEIEANALELEDFASVVSDRRERLLSLEADVDGTRPFSSYTGGFGGYRLADLDRSAWTRISIDAIANHMEPDLLRDAFVLYRGQDALLNLDGEVNRLVFGPEFHAEEQALVGFRISAHIMSQQIALARRLASLHLSFLEEHR